MIVNMIANMVVRKAKKVTVKAAFIFLSSFCFVSVSLHAMDGGVALSIAPSPRSPLRSAVIAGNEPLVRELLSTGAAEVDEVDAQQRTALHIMLGGSDTPLTYRMVRLLLESKASVERADSYGIMPLDFVNLKDFSIQMLFFGCLCKEDKAVIKKV